MRIISHCDSIENKRQTRHTLRWRTGPDVSHTITQLFGVIQIPEKYLMIDSRSVLFWSEKVDRIQIRQIDSS